MEEQKILIEDDSEDKKFFTILPNYILNNSTAVEQALYAQLKRLAGEGDGKICYPSLPYLRRQLRVGYNTLKKSLQYLIVHKWINTLGKRQVKTKGGYQWVNTYRINNIWKLNMDYYEGCSNQTNPDKNKGGPKETKGSPEFIKGGPVLPCKEEPLKKEHNKEEQRIATQSIAGKGINDLIELFKEVNPSYERLFGNKTQRACLERMVKKHGKEKIEWAIQIINKTNKMPYAPTITTPFQLEEKLASLIVFLQKEKIKGIQSL